MTFTRIDHLLLLAILLLVLAGPALAANHGDGPAPRVTANESSDMAPSHESTTGTLAGNGPRDTGTPPVESSRSPLAAGAGTAVGHDTNAGANRE